MAIITTAPRNDTIVRKKKKRYKALFRAPGELLITPPLTMVHFIPEYFMKINPPPPQRKQKHTRIRACFSSRWVIGL
jgi:hypothetical protein